MVLCNPIENHSKMFYQNSVVRLIILGGPFLHFFVELFVAHWFEPSFLLDENQNWPGCEQFFMCIGSNIRRRLSTPISKVYNFICLS